ncbi:MAG: VWA domain-containing protein [Aureliella sp.]
MLSALEIPLRWLGSRGTIELRNPEFLLLLLLLPLGWWLMRRPRATVAYSSVALLAGGPTSIRQRLCQLPTWFSLLALAMLIIALARPRTPNRDTRISREGIAIMMMVDRSGSMNARDLVPDDLSKNRLDVVKDMFVKFVLGDDATSGRPDDLVGLISFAGFADSICPLTLDHPNLASIANQLEIVTQRSEDGTAIGDALGLAVERLRRSKAKSRIAILLTDGVNTAGVIAPEKAADLAEEFDIKVYCIGAGTNGTAPMPINGMFGRIELINQPVVIDEDLLKSIADRTGGQYFRAEDAKSLEAIYEEINELERTEVSELRYLLYTEHFQQFVLWAAGFLALATVLRATILRRLP